MSVWHIISDSIGEWGEWWQVSEGDGCEAGKSIRRWERSRYDSKTQLRHTEILYEVIENDKIIYSELHHRSPEMRNYSVSQPREMLRFAGFSNIQAFSGITNRPAEEIDEVFCILGNRT